MHTEAFIIVASLVFAFGLVSKRLASSSWTPPLVFVVAGVLLGPWAFGWLDIDIEHGAMRLLAELTLILVLFGDAARIDWMALRHELGLPVRLLGIGMPLSILLGAAVAQLFFPELSWLEAATLSAVLAPTDAALGQAVVSNPGVPVRVRQALNVESGLNDGIALPAVLVLATFASMQTEPGAATELARFATLQVTLGPACGVVVAWLGSRALSWAVERGLIEPTFERLSGIALALLAFACAEYIGGNGFIAAFVAGLTLGQLTRERCEYLYQFLEAEGQLLMLLVFLAFGCGFAGPVIDGASVRGIGYALLSLTAIRMLPVALSLVGTGLRGYTVLFLGWFGPRGLASILFGILIVGELDLPHEALLFEVVMLTVLLSVILHGVTASPFARRYAELSRDADACPAEHLPVMDHPLRQGVLSDT